MIEPRIVVLDVRRQAMKNYNYLLVDPATQDAVMVDPAWEIAKIERAIVDSHAALRGILVTHAHPDHIDLAATMAEKYDCPIWMSKAEIADSGFRDKRLVAADPRPWTIGEMLIEPIFTPGHTPGSTCYLIGGNLFTGDVLFAEGCGMCPNVAAAHAMFASLEQLKRLEPETRVYPGHSYGHPPGRTLAEIQRENIYLHFSDKETFAAFRLRSGQSREKLMNFS
jgi:hydroxyacylglutathione hydrolase